MLQKPQGVSQRVVAGRTARSNVFMTGAQRSIVSLTPSSVRSANKTVERIVAVAAQSQGASGENIITMLTLTPS